MANALTAELNLNIKKFTAALNRAERNAKSFGQKSGRASGKALGKGIQGGVASAMKKVAANITKTMAAVAAAAGVMFARIIQRSAQEAGKMEAAEMRFNILTDDAEKSNKVLRVLRQTAMKTGITFEAMAGNVGKFMAFGFSPEKAMELNKGILDVGGAVGMTNTDMKLLGVALSQVAAKGVGSMEELRQQIAEKGIPIFKALEEQLGVTGAELNKMIQEGKVSADVVLGLFTDVAKGKGPLKDFAGGAAKMATTFQGKVGRMKATWQEFLMKFGDPIIEALKPIMDDLLIIMENMIRNADEWGKKIAAAISKLENLTDPVAKMSDSLEGFEKAWDAFVAYASAALGNALVRSHLRAVNRMKAEQVKMLDDLGLFIARKIAEGFTGALHAGLASWITGLMSGMLKVASIFVDFLAKRIPDILPFSDTAKGVMGKASDILGGASDIASSVSGAISDVADSVKDVVGKPFDKISETFDRLVDRAEGDISGALGGIDFFGAGGLREELQEILDGLTPRPKDPEEKMDPATDTSGAPGVAAFGGPMLNGKIDQMNNAIMGRNAFAVIAIEAQKANDQRERMIGHLGRIAANTNPLPDDGSNGLNAGALGAFA